MTHTIIDEEYNNVFTPVITIKSPDNSRTLMEHTFDSLIGSGLRNMSMSISNGVEKTGQMQLNFRDDYSLYDSHVIYKGCRVYVKAKKKHQSQYQNLFAGIIVNDALTESSVRRNLYTINAFSMRHILSHTVVNYERNIPFFNLKENTLNLKNVDPKYFVGNMMEDIFTNINILPNNNGYTLQQRGNFTLNGIDKTIPLTLPSINFLGYVSELTGNFQEMAGCMFGVDEDNDVFFRFPVYKSGGHIIKLHYDDYASDDPNITMISAEPVSRSSSIEPNAYSEVVIAKAFDSAILINNSSTNSHTSLYNKDIAQQIDLRATKLANLTLILSKTGAGTNSPDPENTNLIGFVAVDNNNAIGTDIVAEFSIPLRFIPLTAAPIERINLKYRGSGEVDVTKKYWLVLQAIGDGDDNSIHWWNDDGKAASLGEQTNSAIRDLPFGRGGRTAFSPSGWKPIRNGPIYSHTFTTSSPILHISKAITQKSIYQDPAPVENIQSPSGITDSKTMEQYLGLVNEYASRIAIPYDFSKVSIPDIPIRVGYSLLYYDSGGLANQVNITDVNYTFTAGADRPFGATTYSLSGVGYELSKEFFNNNEFYNQFYCKNPA